MTAARIVERPLTDDEIAHVQHVIDDAGDDGQIVVGAIVATFEALMGADAWQAATSIDPTQYAIPRDQSASICQAMLDRSKAVSGDPLGSVNVGLEWMNRGPSFYDEPEPYDDRPWGEQQPQVDWIESRYDDDNAAEDAFFGRYDD